MWKRALLARLRVMISADPRSLAALRIGLAVLLVANLLGRASHFSALYGQPGVLPTALLVHLNVRWQAIYFPYLLDGSPGYLALLAALSAVFAVSLALGYRTRWSALASWFLLVSLNTRNPLATSYEDHVLQALLFWGIFLPLGARFSLDARWRRGPAAGASLASGATAALVLQFAAIYFFTALHKTGAAWHAEATAVSYTLGQHYVARPIAASLLEHPEVLAFLTRLTWHWELLLPALFLAPVWNGPLRTFGVATVWAFHAGLWVCLALALFPPVMMLGALGLLPTWFWDRLSRRTRSPADVPRAPGHALPASPGWRRMLVDHALPGAFAALMLAANVASLPQTGSLPRWVGQIAKTLRLDQSWRMYAPQPQTSDYYYAMPGTLAGGRRIDLARGGAPVRDGPPLSYPWRDPSRPWSLHLDRARTYGPYVGLRLPVAAWVCRRWNAAHEGEERLVSLEWRVERYAMDSNREHVSESLGSWRCADGKGGFTHPAVSRAAEVGSDGGRSP